MTVYDVSGRPVLRESFHTGPAAAGIPLDLRRLGTGVYLLTVEADRFSATRKLVIGE